MAIHAAHPGRLVLRKLALGAGLSDGELRKIAAHVGECAECDAAIKAVQPDGFVMNLKKYWAMSGSNVEVSKNTPLPKLPETIDHVCAAPVPTQLPGIPGYEILELIGRGGMGMVYKARDNSLNGRLVALKLLRWDDAQPEDLTRFRDEAETAAHLQHANIVQVYSIGEWDNRLYFSQEYVDGGTLADKFSGETCAPRQAAAILRTVAEAVHFAHQNLVLHRDLKPDNVLLTMQGMPKVADFGLAKRLNVDLDRTQTGVVLGTPSYMSPEQASGKVNELTPAADVYALGATLYELLTGRPPFKGATVLETLAQVNDQGPVAPRRLQPNVPLDLETICLKCLEKVPTRRYETARDLAVDLGRFLRKEPILARPASRWENSWKWTQRHPALASALVAAAVATAFLFAFLMSLLYSGRLREQKEKLNVALTEVKKQKGKLNVVLTEVKEQKQQAEYHKAHAQYLSDLFSAQNAYESGDLGVALNRLKNVIPAHDKTPDFRGFEWYYLWQRCHSNSATLRGHAGPVRTVVFSPSGATLASAGKDGSIMIWDVAARRIRNKLKGHSKQVNCLAYSPDGEILASASDDNTVTFWRADTGQLVANLAHVAPVLALTFSPNGGLLATGGKERESGNYVKIKIWNVSNARNPILQKSLVHHQFQVNGLAFSPEGDTLVSAGPGPAQNLISWNLTTYEGRELRGHRIQVAGIAFSPDGQWLASGDQEGKLIIHDLQNQQHQLASHRGIVHSVNFSPDSKTLATASFDQTIQVWNLRDRDWVRYATFRGHTHRVYDLSFSADKKTLASASHDGTVRLWNISNPGKEHLLKAHFVDVEDLEFSADGKLLATTGMDLETYRGRFKYTNAVKLWEPPSKKPKHIFPVSNDRILALAFVLNGRFLAGGGLHNTIHLWDTQDNQNHFTLQGHQGFVLAIAASTDGRTLVTGSFDKTIKVWDVVSKSELFTLRGHNDQINAVAISPDGKTIASGSGDSTLKLWSVEEKKEIRTLKGFYGAASAIVFSPCGKMLAAGDGEGTVYLWRRSALTRPDILKGHTGSIEKLDFSPNGKRLVSASQDGTLKLWDTTFAEERATYSEHKDRVLTAAFSPDGRYLVSGPGNGLLIFRRAATEDEVQRQLK